MTRKLLVARAVRFVEPSDKRKQLYGMEAAIQPPWAAPTAASAPLHGPVWSGPVPSRLHALAIYPTDR